MTRYDFSPLFRSTVGFDGLTRLLEGAQTDDSSAAYPPYNIEKRGQDAYRISMAVAGFAEADLQITSEANMLIVSGRQPPREEGETQYLFRGIASRAFERRFQLADHIKVQDASLKDGLLHIELKREVPEAMKPRRIKINGDIVNISQTAA